MATPALHLESFLAECFLGMIQRAVFRNKVENAYFHSVERVILGEVEFGSFGVSVLVFWGAGNDRLAGIFSKRI